MKYLSTGGGHETDLVGAIMQGLAPDGRLYVPEALPQFDPSAIKVDSIPEIAAVLLEPFFGNCALAPSLADICRDALDFPIPLRALESREGPVAVLELFHGPTAAFKDVGARVLAASMERALPGLDGRDNRPLTILVATSGDTGGAVAAAFHKRPGFRVGVLFPKGQVSPRQQHQLTCWGDNIRSFEVDGSFDDCQALVKGAFGDAAISSTHRLGAANSINVGRLLPQVVYHAAASLWYWREHDVVPNFIVPTGNLGNAMACVWARAIGLPIGQIILATNANRTIPDYLATGDWQPRASIQTLASAMDVGDPSNMERLRDLYPALTDLRGRIDSYPVDDEAIRDQIARDYERYGDIWCPHTATGFRVYDQLAAASKRNAWIVAATAHPAKFDNIVEGVIGTAVDVPPALAALLERPTHVERIGADLVSLRDALEVWNSR